MTCCYVNLGLSCNSLNLPLVSRGQVDLVSGYRLVGNAVPPPYQDCLLLLLCSSLYKVVQKSFWGILNGYVTKV
jgi:hypothetical protein